MYSINPLGSKTTLKVLRVLYDNQFKYLSIPEISRILNTSRSNVHRAIGNLKELGLIRNSNMNGNSLVRVDTSSQLSLSLFIAFNHERMMNIDPDIRSAINVIISRSSLDIEDSIILFGSRSRGTSTEESDVDLLIITEEKRKVNDLRREAKEFLPDIRFEIHHFREEDINKITDLVLTDAVLHGISFYNPGSLFMKRTSIDSLESSYLNWRLRSCKKNLRRAIELEGDSSDYFIRASIKTMREIGSLLRMPLFVTYTKEITIEYLEEVLLEIQEELSGHGDKIWLN